MIGSIFCSALFTLTEAAPASTNSRFLEVPLRREFTKHSNSSGDLSRRSSDSALLDFIGYRYLADYQIAGQDITAILDTGSSNTWVYNNDFRSPGYNPSASSTHKYLGKEFNQCYGDCSYGVSGTWFEDTFTIADVSVDSYPFGLVNYSNYDGFGKWSLLGFGPREAENLGSNSYPTFVERLVEQGDVAANAFSIYITNENQTNAQLLIGGIDTEKFEGPLYTVPLDTTENYGKYFYAVNFKFQGEPYTSGLLDTGNPAIVLPQSVVDDVAKQFGCWWSYQYSEYEVIDLPQSDGLVFEVGGINVTVPVESLFLPSYYKNGYQVYWLTIRANAEFDGTPQNALGDPFLRQLYYVIDPEIETFGFAPVRYSSESNISEISSTEIPGARKAPDQSVGGSTYLGESNSQRATNPQCKLVDGC